jgi:hypothetical protein
MLRARWEITEIFVDWNMRIFGIIISIFIALFSMVSISGCNYQKPAEIVQNQPAKLQGSVAVTDTIITGIDNQFNSPAGVVYWIVKVSVTNQSYQNSITENPGYWRLNISGTTYLPHGSLFNAQSATPMNVPTGKTGVTTIRYAVPGSSSVASAKLEYIGQTYLMCRKPNS